MTPTVDFLRQAERHIRSVLEELRPRLLEAQGSIEHRLKDDKSVVTEMDLLVEERLRNELHALEPGIAFCGEETGVDYDQPTFWLTDPIDGTEAFIRGVPFATNMLSLIHGGEPLLGIIYNFSLGDYYVAIKGQGATCNGHPIHVSNRPLERSYVVLTGQGAWSTPDFAQTLRKRVAGIAKLNASGFEAALVASGVFDGKVVSGNKGPWDFAAGCLLIREAGGLVRNIGSNDYNYRNLRFVAGNPTNFAALNQLVAESLIED